jgi:hypothetical protein
LNNDLSKTFQEIANKHGILFHGSKISYDDHSATLKCNIMIMRDPTDIQTAKEIAPNPIEENTYKIYATHP